MAKKLAVPELASPAEIENLRNALYTMDTYSQVGLSKVACVAKLALISLETSEGHRDWHNIARALMLILDEVEAVESFISCEAEKFSCAYVEKSDMKRRDAARAAQEVCA